MMCRTCKVARALGPFQAVLSLLRAGLLMAPVTTQSTRVSVC